MVSQRSNYGARVSLLRNAYISAELPAPCAHIPLGSELTWCRPTCGVLRNRHVVLYRPDSFSVFAELQDAVEEVLPTLREQGISVYILSESCNIQGIDSLSNKISQASDKPLSPDLRANVNIRSTALYIYTSGTTGTSSILLWKQTHKVKSTPTTM